MSLLVWLPMTKDLSDQGLGGCTITNEGATLDNNGKLGKCYNFDGTNDRIKVSGLNNPKNITVAFWIKRNATTNTRQFLFTAWNGVSIELSAANNLFGKVQTSSGEAGGASGGTVTADSGWIHVCYTFEDKVGGKMYINGVLTGSGNTTSSIAWNVTLGYIGNYSNIYLNAKLNDFRIYDSCLSPKEVEVLSRGLVCHYPLEGANDTLLPFGYQQLEYIESAGAAAFDTTYKFNPEIDSVKITFKGNDTSNNGMLFGQSAGKYFWLYYYGNNGIRVYANNGSGQQSIAGISSDLNKHTAEYKNKHYYIDGTDKGSLSNTYAEQTTTSWICSYGSTNYGFKGRIYFAQICRSGVPQRTFIPAKRLSDSKIGMYDVSNNVFYPSDTSTAFTAGNVVGTPTTIYDCSGYQNNGTVSGSLTTSNDTARYSASTYIPKAGYIQHPNALGTDKANQEWTCCAWVKLTNTDSNQQLNNFNIANQIRSSATPLLYINSGSHDYYMYGSVALSTDTWTHIAFVFKNSTGLRNVYINGELKNSYGPNKDSTPAGIPSTVTIFGGNFDGYVSDYREYATALSATQVAELYNTAVSVANNGTLMGYELVEV